MITFVGVFSVILALLALVTSVFFFGGGIVSSLGMVGYFSRNPYEFRLFISFFIFGLYLTAQGAGLLNKKEWARILTILLPAAYIGFNFSADLDMPSPIKLVMLSLYGLFLVVYFLQPTVGAQFKKQLPPKA